ncbi:MAG: thioredoxin [Planctomycetota bacterium]|jgi:thioredoxin 1|nr:thioredoxin [Planctomycetota bacterium]
MSGKTAELTDENFSAAIASGVTLVDFWASWCPPCRRQGPIVDRLAETYSGRAKIAKMDTDANSKTALELKIENIPTLIVFKNGREAKRLVGLTEPEALSAVLDRLLER